MYVCIIIIIAGAAAGPSRSNKLCEPRCICQRADISFLWPVKIAFLPFSPYLIKKWWIFIGLKGEHGRWKSAACVLINT
jgi:hypothetical protein